jgi:hypothetical protein
LRSRIRLFRSAVVVGLLLTTAWQGTAAAAPAAMDFVAHARAAGLTAEQATELQATVDGYLVKLAGRGTQVSPNQIDMHGAILNVAIPGEKAPRQLVPATRPELQSSNCRRWSDYPQPWLAVDYGWFCAYSREWGEGSYIGMYDCAEYPIPWFGEGSWLNNQTTGTVPRLYFTVDDGRPPWDMPAAFSMQGYDVNWAPVTSIQNC